MKWLVVAAWLAVAAGVAARIRGGDERCTAGEAITLALAATLVVVGVAGTLLAALGAFSAPVISLHQLQRIDSVSPNRAAGMAVRVRALGINMPTTNSAARGPTNRLKNFGIMSSSVRSGRLFVQ